MSDNMSLWEQVKRPPSEALKKITGGRLKGMTDIKPQWRYQVMTEVFGPCGEGWRFTIDNLWTEAGSDGQIIAFAQISLFHKTEKEWSAPIPGVGGSLLVAKESAGLHTSDEAYKMAITDALSVAMKHLGVAADIYAGLWDGSKYREAPKEPVRFARGVKDKVLNDSIRFLEQGDADGLKQVWAEFDADEKVALWPMFNSTQRAAIKELMK